jgi:hypothetical protein
MMSPGGSKSRPDLTDDTLTARAAALDDHLLGANSSRIALLLSHGAEDRCTNLDTVLGEVPFVFFGKGMYGHQV